MVIWISVGFIRDVLMLRSSCLGENDQSEEILCSPKHGDCLASVDM